METSPSSNPPRLSASQFIPPKGVLASEPKQRQPSSSKESKVIRKEYSQSSLASLDFPPTSRSSINYNVDEALKCQDERAGSRKQDAADGSLAAEHSLRFLLSGPSSPLKRRRMKGEPGECSSSSSSKGWPTQQTLNPILKTVNSPEQRPLSAYLKARRKSDYASDDVEEIDLNEEQQKRLYSRTLGERIRVIESYCGFVLAAFWACDLLFLCIFRDMAWYAATLVGLFILTDSLSSGCLVKACRARSLDEKAGALQFAAMGLQLRASLTVVLCFGSESQITRAPDSAYLRYLIGTFHGLHVLALYFSLQNALIAREVIKSERLKDLFYYSASAFSACHMAAFSFWKLEQEDLLFLALLSGITGVVVVASVGFLAIWVRIKKLTQALLSLEMEASAKYKRMFNSIEEAIMVVKEGQIHYFNKQAIQLYFRITKSNCSFDSKNSLDTLERSLVDIDTFFAQKLFCLFQADAQEDRSDSDSPAELQKGFYSLRDLLGAHRDRVSEAVFTNIKELSMCDTMDQMQLVIEKLGGGGDAEGRKRSAFFQIRVLDLADDGEQMIQVRDISQRVLGQSLRTERKYMSIMNSTTSHEMRNPLNAIHSNIEQQLLHTNKLKSILSGGSGLKPEAKSQLGAVFSAYEKSLKISKCSCSLLMFNVEDLLALPQLKQGKLPKSAAQIDIRQAIDEVVAIMDYQLDTKGINVEVLLEGFTVADASEFNLVFFDKQRFQQVLLNFLSNAAKFVEGAGRIHILLQKIPAVHKWGRDHAKQLERKILGFYGSDFDADSDSDGEEQPATGEVRPSLVRKALERNARSQRWTASQKREFREAQKLKVGNMLQPEDCDKLVLSVLDTGVGISVRDQAKLFKLFGTLSSTRKLNTKGVGLGLSISRMISQEFGGDTAVQSRPGFGSVFHASMQIPFEDPASTSGKKKSEQQIVLETRLNEIKQTQRTKARSWLSKMQRASFRESEKRILLLDDEPYNIEVLKQVLANLTGDEGCERVDVAYNAKDALVLVRDSIRNGDCRFSLILTDLNMPIMDGYDFSLQLQSLFKEEQVDDRPTITAVTGNVEPAYIERCFECGMDQVYSKPISSDQIALLALEHGIRVKVNPAVHQMLQK